MSGLKRKAPEEGYKTTAHQSGFHSAKMMIEKNREGAFQVTVDTISQFATSTASDHGTVVTLPKPKEEIADLTAKINPA
jgi:hypothetical protein